MSNDDHSDSEGLSAGSSPASDAPAAGTSKPQTSKRAKKPSKPRLTASQKNFNHKDAENKRRTAIRERFTELSNLVPGAQGNERSEQVMLGKTTDYLKDMLVEQRRLEDLCQEQGITVDPSTAMRDDDFGGPRWKAVNMEQYEASKQKKEGGDAQLSNDRAEEEDD
jgi:heteromeric Ino2p/Ino4p transcription factor